MLDFKKQVIERSFDKPVLVDFWASWCGPCKVLGPVLEQLAEEQKDRWELVKVSTEEHPGLAKEYGIRSIPNVKLFHRGKVVNEFAGALPKFQLEQWLSENIPDPSATELSATLEKAAALPREEAAQLLRQFADAHPENKEAKMALAKTIVFDQPEEAAGLVADIHPTDPQHDDAVDVLALARLMQARPTKGSKASELLFVAQHALRENDPETAIQKIIEAVMADKKYMDDLPRLAGIALFHIWGKEHELTKEYRRGFDMALY